jgi:cytochrome c biogenesis protein ResB
LDRSTAVAAQRGRRADRLARQADRLLRLAADVRLALGLLLLAGAWNALAAALPNGGVLLDAPPYLVLLGAILLCGMAGVFVRVPPAWREWRRPSPPPAGDEALVAEIPLSGPLSDEGRGAVAAGLRGAGYRVMERGSGDRWTVAGVRRGWSRFAGMLSHLALVLLVLGAAIGTAFSSEATFSLLPGEQAQLDSARPGFTDAVRLDAFDAEFGTDGRPRRLDTTVTFLRDGEAVRQEVMQVNRPGDFGGYLLHGWTYGPAARLRITTLGGQPLLDTALALDGSLNGRPAAFAELPTRSLTLGVQLVDADANLLAVGIAGSSGLVDSVQLPPGAARRLGDIVVEHAGFASYVTFLSRRDPGQPVLFAGAGLLVASLALAFWLPRRRAGVSVTTGGLRLVVRGERFDRPDADLARLSAALRTSLADAR